MQSKIFYKTYQSFIGQLHLYADENNLLYIKFNKDINIDAIEANNEILNKAIYWLDNYFLGNDININIPYRLNCSKFQNEVLNIAINIKYGDFMTYDQIAKIIAKKRNITKMSAQAVGQALKNNPLPIFIPCHRVLNSKMELTGYNGGIINKAKLLEHEKIIYKKL